MNDDRKKFIQKVVIKTLAYYLLKSVDEPIDYSHTVRKCSYTMDEAQNEAIKDANKLADKLGLS